MHPETIEHPKARYIVPAAVAIMLIFGRSCGMIPFIKGSFNMLDQAMNIFVVVIAPFFAIKEIMLRPKDHNFSLLLPVIFFWAWMSIEVGLLSSPEYWPDRTALISIALSILFCSQIHHYELRRVRLFILVIGVIFCISVLLFAQADLHKILSGRLVGRLGVKVSAANVIVYPRMLYMLVLTCMVTVLIEKRLLLKLVAAAIIPLPMLIALSTGGRGAMVGLGVGAITFVLGFGKMTGKLIGAVITGLVAVVGYQIVFKYLPLMQERLQTKDASRAHTWKQLLNMDNVSLIGTGLQSTYPHNIFVECLVTYGIIGFALFLLLLYTTLSTSWKSFRSTRNNEVLWIISLLVLQLTAQQFSLDVFATGALWATMVLPLGLGLLKKSQEQSEQLQETCHMKYVQTNNAEVIRSAHES